MRHHHFRPLSPLAALAVLWIAAPARADLILYDNGPPQLELVGLGASLGRQLAADDFTLTTTATLTSVRFWSYEPRDFQVFAGSFAWTIYGAGSGPFFGPEPGEKLARGTAVPTTRVATGVTAVEDLMTFDQYAYEFELGPLTLGPGTYWLGLHNGPLDEATNFHFWWAQAAGNGTPTSKGDTFPFEDLNSAGRIWGDTGGQLAFQIRGAVAAVPEPGTFALAAGGVLGGVPVVLRRWGRRARP